MSFKKKYSYVLFWKRVIDLLLAITIGILILPILILCSILIVVTSKGPIFFKQERLGYKGKVFQILKFRSMTNSVRIPSKEIFRDNPDVTLIGHFLRRFKIDELPQIINILKGDMSFVGPRPGLPEQLKSYNSQAVKRLSVKPGLTGLAQVHGNIHLSWPERWEYDALYVEKVTFSLDLKIIVKTIMIVFLGEEKFLKKING